MILPKEIKKLISGIRRYGWLRAITGMVRLLRFRILKPQRGTVSTITDGLIISFDYPEQLVGSLVVFRELIEPEYQFVRKALRKDSVFFDVGAGIGAYSLCAAKVVAGPVHAFEPIEENVRLIRHNLRVNDMESKVRLSPVALSAKDGFGQMATNHDADLFVSQLRDVSVEYHPGAVKVTTLDSYCEMNDVESIDVIKIDVEGHEPDVIEGAERLISRKKIAVMILEADHRRERFYTSLQQRGFDFFYYDCRRNTLERIFPICERTLRNEPSSVNSNVVLIRREELGAYRSRFRIVWHE